MVQSKTPEPEKSQASVTRMALRYRRFREISRILPRIHSGDHLLQCGLVTKLSALSIIPQSHALERIDTEISQCGFRAKRSTLWAFVSGGSIHSAADRSHLIQYILKEYITFPIILSNKNFTEMENGACCILFKGFKSPVVYHEKDMDLRVLNKAVEDLLVQDDGSSRSCTNLKSTWTKQPEIIKESYGDSLRNLLFYLPGCISANECGNRLFLSDSNHHRIIVVDGNGHILDCIGSSPGFEDGNFECAKLARPAASFYDAAEDCLYFVDSENLEYVRPSGYQNFGILGLRYWLPSSLDKVYTTGSGVQGVIDHLESFSSLLPGRVLIQLNVEVLEDTELVEQLQEGCIWRQARSRYRSIMEDVGGASEKVPIWKSLILLSSLGFLLFRIFRSWYDELDNLALSILEPDTEFIVEDDIRT